MSINKTRQSPKYGPEQHHGDLRKGAFLHRRAAYQTQTDRRSPTQTGTTTKKLKDEA